MRFGTRRDDSVRRPAEPGATRASAGYTLTEVLVVLVIIAILAAIALPTYLGQRDRAKDAAVKEGVHAIQIGVQTWATENDDQYPAAAEVGVGGAIGPLVHEWPHDPWSNGAPMANNATMGNYTYTLGAGGTTYTLDGHGKNGVVIRVP